MCRSFASDPTARGDQSSLILDSLQHKTWVPPDRHFVQPCCVSILSLGLGKVLVGKRIQMHCSRNMRCNTGLFQHANAPAVGPRYLQQNSCGSMLVHMIRRITRAHRLSAFGTSSSLLWNRVVVPKVLGTHVHADCNKCSWLLQRKLGHPQFASGHGKSRKLRCRLLITKLHVQAMHGRNDHTQIGPTSASDHPFYVAARSVSARS